MSKDKKNENPKNFDEEKLRLLLSRLIKQIKGKPEGHFKFKKMRGFCGVCEWEDGIKIDYRKPIIPTIIHEILHDMYPDNSEEWVLRLESKIVQILNSKDIYKLMSYFLSKLELQRD
jgi:hypothetical protein